MSRADRIEASARDLVPRAPVRRRTRQEATDAACELVLHAIRCGHSAPLKIMGATRLGRTGAYRALGRCWPGAPCGRRAQGERSPTT